MSERTVGARKPLSAEVEGRPVLGLQSQITKRERVEPLIFQLRDAEEVAGRLGHPRAREHEQPTVHPQSDYAVARHSLGLRDLCLVVGKDVVGASGVDVETFAEQ